ELNRPGENAAVLLDAVAHSVGQRIVRDQAGNVYAMGAATSAERVAANLELATPMAGGAFEGTAPENISVWFQPYFEGAIDPTGAVFTTAGDADTFPSGPLTA